MLALVAKYQNTQQIGLKLLKQLVSSPENVTLSNIVAWVDVISSFTHQMCPIPGAIEAMEILYSLFARVAQLQSSTLGLQEEQGNNRVLLCDFLKEWNSLWFPVFNMFCTLCADPRLEVRNCAVNYMQRCLLSPYLDSLAPLACYNVFHQVIKYSLYLF